MVIMLHKQFLACDDGKKRSRAAIITEVAQVQKRYGYSVGNLAVSIFKYNNAIYDLIELFDLCGY